MNSIFSCISDVREPPLPRQGEDLREPPLPSNNGSKDELPSEADRIDPANGGGRAPRRVVAGASPSDPQPQNQRTDYAPKELDA